MWVGIPTGMPALILGAATLGGRPAGRPYKNNHIEIYKGTRPVALTKEDRAEKHRVVILSPSASLRAGFARNDRLFYPTLPYRICP